MRAQWTKLIAVAALLFGGAAQAESVSRERLQITSESGAELPVLVETPAKPKGSIILLISGDGAPRLHPKTGAPTRRKDAYPYRGRRFLLQDAGVMKGGYALALMDAPKNREGLRPRDRLSPAHRSDIAAVIAEMRRRIDGPVWLFGAGEGAISAVNAAAALPDQVDGVILASPIRTSNPRWSIAKKLPHGVASLNTGAVRQPVFIIDHPWNNCPFSWRDNAPSLDFKNAEATGGMLLKDFNTKPEALCADRSAHGLLGGEYQASYRLLRFMEQLR